jgi:hypothetical protein
LDQRDKKALREQLYKTYGTKCHYCGIEEKDIQVLWNKFYGSYSRSRHLEIEHKNGNHKDFTPENLTLACCVCNCAKSDVFNEEEFKKVGKTIQEVWKAKAEKLA